MTFSSPLNKRGVTPAAMVAAISGYAMDGFDLLILRFHAACDQRFAGAQHFSGQFPRDTDADWLVLGGIFSVISATAWAVFAS